VTSSWFLQGRWVEAHPATARRVAADGHLVGNHTFYHARLPLLTAAGLRTDVRSAERVIRDVVGVDPRPWFRSPFAAGARDRRIQALLAQLGYREIRQDVVLDDWEPERAGAVMAADALRLVPDAGDPAVVLFHAWPPGTLEALPAIIDGLRQQGARFVRVDDLSDKELEAVGRGMVDPTGLATLDRPALVPARE
jgi:peptidoglycan/xylan/chitin deacetylase (PgdA/CDA1 family)